MKRSQVLELRRKKLSLLGKWNELARAYGGATARETPGNLQTAGRLLELCQDKQRVFEERARRFLGESWRSYRRIGDLYKAWTSQGDSGGKTAAKVGSISAPGEWSVGNPHTAIERIREAWNDPRNVTPEQLKAAARRVLEKLRARG